MKRDLGIARCGLACCLCSESDRCGGCDSGSCPDTDHCLNRACSMRRGIPGCHACNAPCSEGMQSRMKPRGFTEFIRRYGLEALLDCLAANEARGVVYHREGITGDYDGFDDLEALIRFIRTGRK